MKQTFVMYRDLFLQGGNAHCYVLTHDDDNRVSSMTQLDTEERPIEWGYTGGGPHNLSHAILNAYADKGTADRYFRSFVVMVVSMIPMELPLWFYTDKEVESFLSEAKRNGYTW